MNILEKIESLRKDKTPDEIEITLLNEELGKIYPDPNGYQYIENIALSWLVVEVHEPGFIECMWTHQMEYVVHHIDGNPLNNTSKNLRVMEWAEHSRMHINEYYADPVNAKDIEARGKKHSDWRKDPKNARTVKAIGEAISKTYRKEWIDLSVFTKPFTIKEYAEASEVGYSTAWLRISILLSEDQIICEKKLVGRKQCNVFRRTVT